jgi:hypothetical protein
LEILQIVIAQDEIGEEIVTAARAVGIAYWEFGENGTDPFDDLLA